MEQTQNNDLLKIFDFAVANVPIIEENLIINTRTPWVYYGIANLAPQELIRLYNSSPTHRASVQSKWFGVRGEKIYLENGDDARLVMVNSLGETISGILMFCGAFVRVEHRKQSANGGNLILGELSVHKYVTPELRW